MNEGSQFKAVREHDAESRLGGINDPCNGIV